MDDKILWNLPSHANVCSHAWVLYEGWDSLSLLGLYNWWHSTLLWFLRWKVSIIFEIFFQIWLYGAGNGSSSFVTFIRSMLQILSYATNISDHSSGEMFSSFLRKKLTRKMNTCDGDSDLRTKITKWIIMSRVVLIPNVCVCVCGIFQLYVSSHACSFHNIIISVIPNL